ncbi:epoxide hydrolase N-terminal domain-containing protein [Streptomyces sp. LZ34]
MNDTAPGTLPAIRPFRIVIPQSDLDDLRERLTRTRRPDELPGAGWPYGVPLDYVREVADYWAGEFDWRAREAPARFEQLRQARLAGSVPPHLRDHGRGHLGHTARGAHSIEIHPTRDLHNEWLCLPVRSVV